MSMRDSMVEKVARALAYEAHENANDYSSEKELSSFIDFIWSSYVPTARAAIAAMREPTEGMKMAVDKAEDDLGICHEAYEHIDWYDAWPAAIDAALKEGE